MSKRSLIPFIFLISSACADGREGDALTGLGGVSASDGTATSQGDDTSSQGSDGSGDSADTGEDGDDGNDGGDIKFDTEAEDPPTTGGDMLVGCDKVDFLFVIDNSGSMSDEQQALIGSFSGFISEIQDTLMAQDYHIMVTDTDSDGKQGSCFQSTCCNVDCQQWCGQCVDQGCDCVCNNQACPVPPAEECDDTLGAGKTKSEGEMDCGIQGDQRFMVDGQPNLTDTFACAALVGTDGDGSEKPMQAVMDGVTDLNQPGECNEGFLRDDALLVVTVITDEEDDGKSDGDPALWKQIVVDAKGGEPNAVVPLALVGDTDLQNPVCEEFDGDVGADGSPRLRAWAESFEHGMWGSVCSDDYAPFFAQAVSTIDLACDEFEPEG
jgi:hypothetical protein